MNNSPVKIWRNQKHIREMLGQTGTIVSFTRVRVPPNGFAGQAPYPVVLVDLSKGRMTAQLVDYNETQLKTGQKVTAVLRRVKSPEKEGVIPYGIKFKPI